MVLSGTKKLKRVNNDQDADQQLAQAETFLSVIHFLCSS